LHQPYGGCDLDVFRDFVSFLEDPILAVHMSVEKIRSVPYRYGELLALLVYLTWLLHRGLGFESLVVPWKKIYHNKVITCT
jgi:hypothetical protein